MKLEGKFYYDKVLPMGCSISCNLFEELSTALHWIMVTKFQAAGVVHVLDDFLFVGPPLSDKCFKDLTTFLALCQRMGIPIKHTKTVQPTTVITFLGVELDSDKMEARLPSDKIQKITELLGKFNRKKKVTLQELQSLIGLLNFACTVVAPGRPFLRRLIDLTRGISKPNHFIRLNREAKADIKAWLEFVVGYNGISLFLPDRWDNSEHLHFYTDASGIGYGAVFGKQWFYGEWPDHFRSYHITIKELFPIVLAVEIWADHLRNKCIMFHCDNEAVVTILTKHTSKDSIVMKLVRRLIVQSLKNNFLFSSVHIMGKKNVLADRLSRLQVTNFRDLAPHMDSLPVLIHPALMKV